MKVFLGNVEFHREYERKDSFFTTDQWWDCECKTNYIKHKTVGECPSCGAEQEGQPDSRVHEVLNKLTDIFTYILVKANIKE